MLGTALAVWVTTLVAVSLLGWLRWRAKDRRARALVKDHLTTTVARTEQAAYMRRLDLELDDMTEDVR